MVRGPAFTQAIYDRMLVLLDTRRVERESHSESA
jgi:hypothetical protein